MFRYMFFASVICLITAVCKPAKAELVAYWDFNSSFAATTGGSDYDLATTNGPQITSGTLGRFGEAASFSRASSQYAFTSGNVLAANSDFSYTSWFNFTGGNITGGNRYFVLETTAGNSISSTEAWTASLGLRDLGSGDIAEFFTSPSRSFGTTPFAAGWNNAIVTYDADGGTNPGTGLMRAYLNGNLASTYDNVLSTTAVEGLVIGGHRAGTGRNFEGLIDDVAFYNSVLSDSQISSLQNMSAGQLAAVPEPGSVTVLLCCAGLAILRRRQR